MAILSEWNLSRFHEAWDLCKSGGAPADWAELGKACLIHMEVDLAVQIYRMCGNVGMVLSLQSIQVQVTWPWPLNVLLVAQELI